DCGVDRTHVVLSSNPPELIGARTGRSSFFSSRRRHPRLVRDWSSDVCSSDLTIQNCCFAVWGTQSNNSVSWTGATPFSNRLEERRVGKEGRFRWAPDH